MYGAPVGTRTLTGSDYIIPATHQGRVFNMHILAAATTTVALRETGPSGTLRIQEIVGPNVLTSNGAVGVVANPNRDYGINGYVFVNGIYLTLTSGTSLADGNTAVTISYRQEEKVNA